MIRSAAGFGLDGLVFADHGKHIAPARAAELSAKFAPFRVFRGIEVSVAEGEDIVVLGVYEDRLEAEGLSYAELFSIARGRGGFLILAHPFRYHESVEVDLSERAVDAIELHSICIPGTDEDRIRELIRRVGCRTVHDSDAHRAESVGIFHNLVHGTPASEAELVELLRAGEYECCRCDGRIAQRNREVQAEEAKMRDYISRGLDGKAFRDQTGGSMDHFVKVRRGGTYLL